MKGHISNWSIVIVIPGIFGTTDFSGKDEPRFHIALGTPSHDFITAGLHADQESPRELNDYLARVAGEGWYLATLTYDGHQSGPGEELYFPSTVFYLDTQRGMGNSLVNIGKTTKINILVRCTCNQHQ